jgi:DNA-binding MurR/RpiR family transcriptional regulator
MGDRTYKAMGSLADLLIDYVGSTRVHDQNYDIAQGLLRSYSKLSSMSLRQMADVCYVSPASFSRFCRYMGFADFLEFKEAVDGTNYRATDDYSRQFYDALMNSESEALEMHRAKVVDVLGTTLREEDLSVISEVTEALDEAHRIAFFSHHFLWHVGRYFQGRMLLLGRYVELYQSYAHQEELAAQLNEGDLAFICSLNGSFFANYSDLANTVFRSGAKVVVLTQNKYAMFVNRADYVLLCGTSNENDVGKYAALLTTDSLVLSYMRHVHMDDNV